MGCNQFISLQQFALICTFICSGHSCYYDPFFSSQAEEISICNLVTIHISQLQFLFRDFSSQAEEICICNLPYLLHSQWSQNNFSDQVNSSSWAVSVLTVTIHRSTRTCRTLQEALGLKHRQAQMVRHRPQCILIWGHNHSWKRRVIRANILQCQLQIGYIFLQGIYLQKSAIWQTHTPMWSFQ